MMRAGTKMVSAPFLSTNIDKFPLEKAFAI